MISIIIPVYNAGNTIKKTLSSILTQTYKDLEIIVVLDGQDKVIKQLLATRYPIVKVLEQEHKGANVARNLGARKAKGEYLFFCDDDVVLKKNALEKLKNVLDKNKTASYSYCSFKIGWKKIKSRIFDVEELKKRNYISTMSLIRTSDFLGFDEKIKKFQDWDLWLTMLEKEKLGIFVNEVLFWAKPSRHGKSKWLPRIFYRIPWEKFGIRIKALERYKEAREKIKEKHGL